MDNNRLILIVDDSEADVELLKIAIRKAHVSNPIQVVHDGQVAIDYLCGLGEFANRQLYPFPGVIFSWGYLPGFKNAQALRFRCP
jgi:hypothetical protein